MLQVRNSQAGWNNIIIDRLFYRHAEQVFVADGFKDLNISGLQKLLQHNRKMWNISEARILEGVKTWATAECIRQGRSPTGPNQYMVAKLALSLIDFKKFTALEFTTQVVKQKLLPDFEMLTIQSELIEREENMKADGAPSTPSSHDRYFKSQLKSLQDDRFGE